MSAGDAAARQAGLVHALNSDRRLKRVFSGERPSDTYRRPSTSLCGDFDGDGVTDRAVHYQCCTVSSPAPWLVLSAAEEDDGASPSVGYATPRSGCKDRGRAS